VLKENLENYVSKIIVSSAENFSLFDSGILDCGNSNLDIFHLHHRGAI